MAPGDTVYASLDSLYVATTRWVESEAFDDEAAWEDAWRQRRTSLHRFDISGDEADYESSGAVLGVIHNQFSLSEHNGHLRVVTTIGDPWGDESESHVRVLSTDGDVLVEVGSVGDIGRGEQVQSVRFVGDIGYVVSEEERAIKSQITTPDETINYCWINVRRSLVVRSIVIGDDLWTLSYPRGNTSGDATGRLEVNDLDTLERLAGVDL